MQRLYPDKVGRLLYNNLYERMYGFCVTYTPEIPPEPFINACLSAFYGGDDRIHIFVDIDNGNIVAHGVATIEENYGVVTINGRQVEDDRKRGEFAGEFIEYLGKLRDEIGASCSIYNVSKNVKVHEKKFGYTAVRTVMVQSNGGMG